MIGKYISKRKYGLLRRKKYRLPRRGYWYRINKRLWAIEKFNPLLSAEKWHKLGQQNLGKKWFIQFNQNRISFRLSNIIYKKKLKNYNFVQFFKKKKRRWWKKRRAYFTKFLSYSSRYITRQRLYAWIKNISKWFNLKILNKGKRNLFFYKKSWQFYKHKVNHILTKFLDVWIAKWKSKSRYFKNRIPDIKTKRLKLKKKSKESKKSQLISFSWLKSLIKSYGNIKNLLNFFFLPIPSNITFFDIIELSFFFRLMHFFLINNRLRLFINIDRWLAVPKSKKYLKKKYLIKNSTVIDKFKRLYNLKFEFFFYVRPRKFDIFYSSIMRKLINRYMYRGQRYLINRVFNNVLIKMKYFVKINLQKIIKIMVAVIRPIFNFVYRRKAKQKFTVPIPIQWYKQYKIALKWIYWTMYNPSYKSLEIQLIKESCRIILRKRNLLLKRRRAFYHNVANNRFFLKYRWK